MCARVCLGGGSGSVPTFWDNGEHDIEMGETYQAAI